MKLTDFPHVIDFPKRSNVVYVLFFGEEGIPFYVGETERFMGRMTDYNVAGFGAATDFKVGQAARYLAENNVRVRVGYQEHRDRETARATEKDLIRQLLRQGVSLLNEVEGYDYRTAVVDTERSRVHQFCNQHILKR